MEAGERSIPLTVLFTDIEGSTALWERDADAMRSAHAQHNRIVSECIERLGGTIVKDRGDGFMAVFDDPIASIAAAVAIQEELGTAAWPDQFEPLKVRAALSTGVVESRDGDFYGPAVNRAARLESAGHGGQILLSEATGALVIDRIPPDLVLADLGVHRLRGMSRDERIYQLAASGLPDTFPPLRTSQARGRHLPDPGTAFHGRSKEIADITRLVEGGARLVTLLGPGGIGKTRLAIEVARRLEPAMTGGAFFADLAPLDSSDAVASALADSVGVHSEGAADIVDLIADRIDGPTLVLVDNFDRLVAAGPLVARLLETSPDLTLLVTSRTPLGIGAERVCRISPLDVGIDGGDSPAVDLFYDRAAAQGATIGAQDRDAVVSICRRVDGLPLAIELVAARTRLLGVAELDRMLERSLDALGSGSADTPERQRTIRSTIDWSLQGVTESQRTLFARLSALPAGATLSMVEGVCGHGLGGSAFDDLVALVDSSLVYAETGVPGGTRFRQLAPLRDYGAELLDAGSGMAAILDRLIDHYVATSQHIRRSLETSGKAEHEVKADHVNLAAALDHSLASGRVDDMADVLMDLWVYWFNGDRIAPLAVWLAEATSRSTSPKIDWLRGLYAFQIGDYATMAERMASALERFSADGDEWASALAATFLASGTEDPQQARTLLESAEATFSALGVHTGLIMTGLFQSVVDFFEGDLESSLRRRRRGLEEAVENGHDLLVAWMRWNVAVSLQALGRSPEAAAALEPALTYMTDDGYQEGIASCAMSIGVLDVAEGRAARGTTLIAAAELVLERVGTVAWVEAAIQAKEALKQAQASLGQSAFDDARARGRTLIRLSDLSDLATEALADHLVDPAT